MYRYYYVLNCIEILSGRLEKKLKVRKRLVAYTVMAKAGKVRKNAHSGQF